MKTKWKPGPPPEIGWWPASANVKPDPRMIRWWNGKVWSIPCQPEDSAKKAAKFSKWESNLPQSIIKWTDRWWL